MAGVYNGDDDVFEIIDHTTASPLESFIAELELVLRAHFDNGFGQADVGATGSRGDARPGKTNSGNVNGNNNGNVNGNDNGDVNGNDRDKNGPTSGVFAHPCDGTCPAGRSHPVTFPTAGEFGLVLVSGGAVERCEPRLREFPLRAHRVQRWFGLGAFAVLSPPAGKMLDWSAAASALSALCVAMGLARKGGGLPVACIVPVLGNLRGAYIGRLVIPDGTLLSLETDRVASLGGGLQRIGVGGVRLGGPARHLSALMDLFASRASLPGERDDGRVTVSAKLSYNLVGVWGPALRSPLAAEGANPGDPFGAHHRGASSHWSTALWEIAESDANGDGGGVKGGNAGGVIPRAYPWPWTPRHPDPVAGLQLSCVFPAFPETFLVDNGVHSDLTPRAAPTWCIRRILSDDEASGITVHLPKLDDSEGTGHDADAVPLGSLGITQALYGILRASAGADGPDPSGGSSVSLLSGTLPSAVVIDNILRDVFDPEGYSQIGETGDARPGRAIKACRHGSMLAALTLQIARMGSSLGSAGPTPTGVLVVWRKFTAELSWAWENGAGLPVGPSSNVDLSTCSVQQMLDALAVCFAQRDLLSTTPEAEAEAEAETTTTTTPETVQSQSSNNNDTNGNANNPNKDDSDDEGRGSESSGSEVFHEANDDEEALTANRSSENGNTDTQGKKSGKNDGAEGCVPMGRSHPSKNGDRLLWTGELVHVPVVLPHAPLTEETIGAHTARVIDGGGGEDASRAQSASVSSDMCAFRAANPGAVLEDFVRWHSPRDLVTVDPTELPDAGNVIAAASEPTSRIGSPPPLPRVWSLPTPNTNGGGKPSCSKQVTLSSRMCTEGNLWRELWDRSSPLPANCQQPLFDHRSLAESILDDLANLPAAEVLAQLCACGVEASLETLLRLSAAVGEGKAAMKEALALRESIRDTFAEPSGGDALSAGPVTTIPAAFHLPLVRAFARAESALVTALSVVPKVASYDESGDQTERPGTENDTRATAESAGKPAAVDSSKNNKGNRDAARKKGMKEASQRLADAIAASGECVVHGDTERRVAESLFAACDSADGDAHLPSEPDAREFVLRDTVTGARMYTHESESEFRIALIRCQFEGGGEQ